MASAFLYIQGIYSFRSSRSLILKDLWLHINTWIWHKRNSVVHIFLFLRIYIRNLHYVIWCSWCINNSHDYSQSKEWSHLNNQTIVVGIQRKLLMYKNNESKIGLISLVNKIFDLNNWIDLSDLNLNRNIFSFFK